jgi:hypothetical protein
MLDDFKRNPKSARRLLQGKIHERLHSLSREMKGENIKVGSTSRKANRSSIEVSFTFFFLNVKKISGSTFYFEVSNIKIMKILSAVFVGFVAYL